MATRKLTRIVPKSLAKLSSIIYGFVGLIIGVFLLIGSLISAANGGHSALIGVALLIAVPILYGVLGAIIGFVGAWLYNLGASKVGGIEVEVE